MKKLSIILTAAVVLFSASAFATDDVKVSSKAQKSFQTDYSFASSVNWEKVSDFYLATFKVNDADGYVAYSEDGKRIGSARKIESANLPLIVSLSLNKNYGGYTLSQQAVEVTADGDTHYYFTAENSKEQVKLNCNMTGEISVDGKTKK